MKSLILSLVFLLASQGAFAFDQSHDLLNQVMKKYNDNGLVDYKGLKATPKVLDQYLKTLADVKESDFNKWSEEDRLAFLINAYNAYTLKAIIENYPIKSSFLKSRIYPKNSIRQIDGVWDKMKWDVMGKKMTLNNIEHDTLRKFYNEPFIHMALVCAALGCPPLRTEAYTGAKLKKQFEDQTRQFLSNGLKFQADKKMQQVSISPIFKWFGEDFVKTYGTQSKFSGKSTEQRAVLNFITPYVQKDQKKFIESGNYDVEYLPYDWTLNEWKK